MNIAVGIVVCVGSIFFVLLSAYLAHKDRFLTVRQMQAKGFPQGLPFLMHGAMWSDLILLSPLFGLIAGLYLEEWSSAALLITFVLGTIISLLLHYLVFLKGSMPGSHGYNGKLSPTGWVHVLYTALALALLFLFYFFTPGIEKGVAVLVSAAVALHLLIGFGSQVLLSLRAPSWFPEKPYKSPALWAALFFLWGLIYWGHLLITA